MAPQTKRSQATRTRVGGSTLFSLLAGLTTTLAAAPAVAADACPDVAERAQESRAKGHLLDAKKDLLQCASDSCPKFIRRDCVLWLDEVQRSIPSVTVVPRHHGKDVVARIRIDGVATEGPGPVQLDPGPHALEVEAEGFQPARDRIMVRAGETTRVVAVDLQRREPSSSPSPPPKALPAAAPSPLGPILVAGVGLAGVATFAAFQVLGRSQRSDIEEGCGRTSTCASDELEPARRSFVVSGVGLAVGAAALTTAALWFFLQPRSRATATAPFTFRF